MASDKSIEDESIKQFKRIAIVPTGYNPVPDVAGGAVEHLITHIILQNELEPHFYFDLFTLFDERLKTYDFKYTNFIFVKNWRKNFFKRSLSYVINKPFKLFHLNFRFNFMANEIRKSMRSDIDLILMENDLDILRALKPKVKQYPIIFHLHNDFDTFAERQKTTKSIKWTINNVNEILAVSNYIKRHLLEKYPAAKVEVLENCIEKKRFQKDTIDKLEVLDFRKKFNIYENDFVIMYSGRIIKQKGVLQLLQACSYLPQDLNYKILIVGETKIIPKKYLIQLNAASNKIKNKVVFTGFIPHYQMQIAYAASDIVVIPSQWQEAFCLSAVEAICNSKPCIASRSGALVDVLNTSCAEYIDLGENFVKDLCTAIYKLYSDEHLRLQMSKNASDQAKRFLDEKQYFERFCTLANKFLSNYKK